MPDDPLSRERGSVYRQSPTEVSGLTRRWVVTTAAAVLFVLAIVVGTTVIVVSAAMNGANGP